MNKKNLFIGLDRDGTLIYDNKYHLGHQKNWKSLIRFLPGVIIGIKKLKKKFPRSKIYIITNQPGVAIKEFPLLTEEKAHEVSKYFMSLLKKKGVKLDGYELCPHADIKYMKRRTKYTFRKNAVCDCSCMKPNPGMFDKALKREGLSKKNTSIYMVGNRNSDIASGVNAGGFGILVPFKGEIKYTRKVDKIKSKNQAEVKTFLEAVKLIIKRES